jgi:hypothetical protein
VGEMHDGKVRFNTRLTGLAAEGEQSGLHLLHCCGFSSWIKCISTTQLALKLDMNSELFIRRVLYIYITINIIKKYGRRVKK